MTDQQLLDTYGTTNIAELRQTYLQFKAAMHEAAYLQDWDRYRQMSKAESFYRPVLKVA